MVALSCPLARTDRPSTRMAGRPAQENGLRQKVCELCRLLYLKGWLNSSGGGISIREGNIVSLAPVGQGSEADCPLGLFLFEAEGKLREFWEENVEFFEHKSMMMLPHILRRAGCVIHSHALSAVLITTLYPESFLSGNCEIPIIENSGEENVLRAHFSRALNDFPNARAILIRGHGLYVWGKDWVETQARADALEGLFQEASVRRAGK